ncbi:8-oxoguanine deaminase [Gynuella sp.]|uniref:8-oxoguanine deaminase n=1 Tax=Gynuella sp. TaxID=2969146 RepID=UPI003D0D6B89
MARVWIKEPLAVYQDAVADCRGGIVVEQSKIVELLGLNEQPSAPVDEVFDASNLVITPGLINTHHHFYQTLTRCLPEAMNKPLFPWLKALYRVWERLTPELLEVSSELAAAELMLSGCTTICDHHYVFPKGLEQAIDIQIAAVQHLGVRATLTRGSMSLGESQGGLPPDSVIQTEADIIADSERLLKSYHDPKEGSMVQLALAPCSPFSVSEQLMKDTAELAQQYQVSLHTHLAETTDENDFCVQKYGMRPTDYLEHCGWLRKGTWLAHGIHFSEQEIYRLGQAEVGIAHCPTSNMLLASGTCPTLDLEQAGCHIGLGVDGSASNDCSNMMQEVRQSLLQQRLKYGTEKITQHTVLNWATRGSAKVLGRSDIGAIEIGKQADLALFALDELRFSGAADPIAALVLCGAQKVRHLMVAGQWAVENGLLHIDLEALRLHHIELARRLL